MFSGSASKSLHLLGEVCPKLTSSSITAESFTAKKSGSLGLISIYINQVCLGQCTRDLNVWQEPPETSRRLVCFFRSETAERPRFHRKEAETKPRPSMKTGIYTEVEEVLACGEDK